MTRAPFTVRTIGTVVQQALVETIDLALRKRPQVEDLAQLAVFGGPAAKGVPDRTLCYVRSLGVSYRFSTTDSSAPDGANVIVPPERPAGGGRWRRCTLAAPYGRYDLPLCQVPPLFLEEEPGFGLERYAKDVQIYEGGADEDSMLDRLFAQRPSYLVKWMGDDLRARSSVPGCMYFGPQQFGVYCIAQNNRPDASALQGSNVSADYKGSGPGINRMVGDLRYVLAGAQLGLDPWVERVEIGDAELVVEDLAQRLFVALVDIQVFAGVHLAEERLQRVTEIAVQPLVAQGELPSDAYVVEGLDGYSAAGLMVFIARGAALVRGVRIAYEPQGLLLPASADCYLDLWDDGTLRPQAVARDAAAPEETGALRVALVRTGQAGVEGFTLLCPSLTRWRTPFELRS